GAASLAQRPESATDHQDQKEHEAALAVGLGSTAVAQAGVDRDNQQSVKEHLSDRVQPASQSSELLVNAMAALIAYTYKEKLPSLNLRVKELDKLLPAAL